MTKKSRQIILVLGDIISAAAALMLTVFFGFWGGFRWQIFNQHLLPFSILYLFWLATFYVFGLYDLNLIKPRTELLTRLGEAFLVCLGIGAIFFYTVPLFGITPKTNLLLNIVIFSALVLLWRKGVFIFFSSFYLERTAVLGKHPLVKKLTEEIKSHPQLGYQFVKFLSHAQALAPQLKKTRINTLIIAQDWLADKNLTQELYKCLSLKIKFMDLAEAYETIFQKIPIDFVDQNWFLENLSQGEKRVEDKIRRIRDIVLAAFLLIITSPLWAVIAAAIYYEDKGPVFYKQKRVGKDRKEFWIFKFRSMRVGAEKKGAKWASKKDGRQTKVGKIIRRIHLDELPQMLNVLKGDIALVGPRPERPEFVRKLEKEIPHYHLRHLITPGFTGWAQVKFRYARSLMDSHEKFQYDLYYIKNRSFFLDLGILLRTFQLFFKNE